VWKAGYGRPLKLSRTDVEAEGPRRAHVGGGTGELSAREFALAELFFRHPGQVLSREQIPRVPAVTAPPCRDWS